MKLLATCLLCLTLSPLASAAPRVGAHDGFTRVVFTLPRATPISTRLGGGHVAVKLGTALPPERGALSAPGVRAYAVKGRSVTLALAPGYGKAAARVVGASGAQPARLVIDVPRPQRQAKNPASKVASSKASSKTAQTAAHQAATPQAHRRAVVRAAGSRGVARPRVVIDPGHGGNDPGMTSPWLREEDVTLDVGRRVRDHLRAKGVDVVMTRDTDRQLSPDKATDLDLRSNMAKTGEVAAYVSIHVNAGDSAGAEGIETYYFGEPLAGSNRSLAVAENGGGSVGRNLTHAAAGAAQNMLGDILAQAKVAFSRQLAEKVQYTLLARTGAVNRGVRTDAFYVIRDPKTAAILTEIGFGSSQREGHLLATPAYREKIASGISRALLDFLHVE